MDPLSGGPEGVDEEKKNCCKVFKKIRQAQFIKHAQNDFSSWHTEKMANFHFFSFTHDMNKRCLLTASQATKQHLVPFAEWNKRQNNPILEEEVGQKYINQNSTIYKHNIFKKNTLWALLMKERLRTSETTGNSADTSFCLDCPWHSVAFPPEIKTLMPICKVSSKQIIQYNSLPSFDRSSLQCYRVTKYILGIKNPECNFST